MIEADENKVHEAWRRAQFISSNCNFCSACFTDVPRYMRRRVTMTAYNGEHMNDVFIMGKDMSPYGKSTSGNFKFLSSKDGLCCSGGCFRFVFGFSIVFWDYRVLNRAVPLSRNMNTRTMAGFLPRLKPHLERGPWKAPKIDN